MLNLAGYDLIIELARGAIEREVLNTPVAVGPGGEIVDTLVPPFRTSQSLPLPGMSALAHLKISDLRLEAVPRTNRLNVQIVFEDTSVEGPGLSVAELGGTATLTVPMRFTSPAAPAGSPPGTAPVSRLVLDFPVSTGDAQLDQPSSDRLDAEVGVPVADAIRAALPAALTTFLSMQETRPLGFDVAVDPANPSPNFLTLTAVPDLLWVDGETLAFFGYHRVGASSGNVAWKTASDLPPAPYASFPWYPVAILISPSSFQQLIACPASWTAARDHVAGKHRGEYVDREREANNNQGPATQPELDAALAKLDADLNMKLREEVVGSVPSPCGQGELDQRVDLPDPFPASTAYIDRLAMTLGQGRIDVEAKAHASVFCGSVNVTMPMWLKPSIGPGNTIVPGPVFKESPDTDVDADVLCEIAVGVLLAFIVGPFLGSVVTLIAFAVGESLAEGLVADEILKQDIPAGGIGSGGGLPAQLRLRELNVEPTGLHLAGTWDGLVLDPHKYEPKVWLSTAVTSARSQTLFPIDGTFDASCGGESGTFRYTRRLWDTTVVLRANVQDVPLPAAYADWWVWIGGSPHVLQTGTIVTPGEVEIVTPPDHEQVELRQQIEVGVQGDNENGWALSFRAEDGNVWYRVETRVVDASGRGWSLWTNYTKAQGMTLEFDEEYDGFRNRCAKRMREVIESYKLVKEVQPWEQVTATHLIVQRRVREAVRGTNLGAGAAIRELMANEPAIAEQLVRIG